MNKLITVIPFLSVILPSSPVLSHSGRTDSSGCHHNRKTGDYHCHNGGSRSSSNYPSRRSSSYSSPSSYGYRSKSSGIKIEYANKGRTNKFKPAQVVGVTDGDTLKVKIDGIQKKIRLYGIDAPESGQAYGKKAEQTLKKLIAGRKVTVKVMDYDRYGRTVALVYADGINVNETLVQNGAAWVYTQYCKMTFCENWYKHQNEARENHKMLWSDSSPMQPWRWRHK